MVWFWLGLLILVSGFVICIFVAPPNALVKWVTDKFELHPQISDAAIHFNGVSIKGKEKVQVIDAFNKALFVERYGFLPERNVLPLIINIKKDKNNMNFFVYSYDDHVDVFRKKKKKLIAYRLISQSLQERFSLKAELYGKRR